MTLRLIIICALCLPPSLAARAQDSSAPPLSQDAPNGQGMSRGRGMGGAWAGRGLMGIVTQAAADHFTVKDESGETYTVHYSPNTRILKQPPRPAGERTAEPGGPGMRTPPQPIKADEIKVGDAIMAAGEVDPGAHSVGAVMIILIDPERARQMEAMRANFGRTWLMGRVTAVNETRVTLHSGVDSADHSFSADENTTFRKHREPVTLADVQVGDNLRVEGSVKDGQFVASTVTVMMPPARSGPALRPGPPPQ